MSTEIIFFLTERSAITAKGNDCWDLLQEAADICKVDSSEVIAGYLGAVKLELIKGLLQLALRQDFRF